MAKPCPTIMEMSKRLNSNITVSESPTFLSLPGELISEILTHVANSSLTDLLNIKLSCKAFCEVAEENYVYQHISLDKLPIVAWPEREERSIFLSKCRRSKNPEAMYRQGVVDYFSNTKLESSISYLMEASKMGHIGACYAMGLIFIFSGGGVTMLSSMKKSGVLKTTMRRCRENLRRIVRMNWVKNPSALNHRPTCCTLQHIRRKKGWSLDEIEGDDLKCEGCMCDEEIELICRHLPPSMA